MAIGLKFPFSESTDGGVFTFSRTTPEKVRTNMLSLLTTKKRHRPMHNTLYSPFFDYIFAPWDEISADKLRMELMDKIGEFMPEVTVSNIVFTFDEVTYILTTKIIYSIIELAGVQDLVTIDTQIQQVA